MGAVALPQVQAQARHARKYPVAELARVAGPLQALRCADLHPVSDGRTADRDLFGCDPLEVRGQLAGRCWPAADVVTARSFRHRPAYSITAGPDHVAVTLD